MSKEIKIAVAGTGYVGLSIATLLAQHHPVTAVDVIPEKVDLINRKKSPIQDEYIKRYLAEKDLNLRATLDGEAAYRDADFIVIAAPTNYDPLRNYFDTHHIEDVIDLVLNVNPDAVMVIKSTIPVGYCRSLYVKYALKFMTDPSLKGHYFNLLFSPEFLRWNLRELSWAILKYSPLIKIETGMRRMRQLQLLAIQMRKITPRSLRIFFKRVQSRRTFRLYSWV